MLCRLVVGGIRLFPFFKDATYICQYHKVQSCLDQVSFFKKSQIPLSHPLMIGFFSVLNTVIVRVLPFPISVRHSYSPNFSLYTPIFNYKDCDPFKVNPPFR